MRSDVSTRPESVPATALNLAVLGDSIAFGQGASRPADTIGARLVAALGRSGTPVHLTMFAVPGSRSDALAAQVRAAAASGPDIALVVIGANDLTHLVPVDRAADLLEHAVRTLRSSGAYVVVVPAPDLGALPWVPVQFRALASAASSALQSAQSHAALTAGARVAHIDATMTAAFTTDPTLLSSDRFHPSSKGYERITAAVLPAVNAAVADVLAEGSRSTT